MAVSISHSMNQVSLKTLFRSAHGGMSACQSCLVLYDSCILTSAGCVLRKGYDTGKHALSNNLLHDFKADDHQKWQAGNFGHYLAASSCLLPELSCFVV